MSDYHGPLPIRTTDGEWVVTTGRSETGEQNNVEIVIYRTDDDGRGAVDRRVFELLPSAAREIGSWLQQTADALDNEYPDRPPGEPNGGL
ncbi:hypothetical protein [Gordonia sp. SL306]|uniref:hypothetical protein n=1 Tax=Gordonia sp. SL306 TaxID=2995145 RepID=UPI002271D42C|nr:hypothetical protein [Gordonia sp. SL306]WAC54260.1 hypothetical protein OVA31_16405 [Gordonia sp. SL306]